MLPRRQYCGVARARFVLRCRIVGTCLLDREGLYAELSAAVRVCAVHDAGRGIGGFSARCFRAWPLECTGAGGRRRTQEATAADIACDRRERRLEYARLDPRRSPA